MEGLLARLRDVGSASQKLGKRLSAYQSLLAEPVANAYARDTELREIDLLVAGFPDSELRQELEKWHRDEAGRVEQDKEEFRYQFGSSLSAGLAEFGLKVKGQLPVLRIGLFSLRVDFGAGTAAVYWGPEVERLKSGLKLVPERLATTVRTWTDDLKKRAADPERLRRQLREAYGRILKLHGLESGTRVGLAEVLAELVLLLQPKSFRADPARERFVEYPRVRFSYDLYRLKAITGQGKEAERLRLHVATFDATTDKTKSFWVPDNEEGDGTYYSSVSFAPEAG